MEYSLSLESQEELARVIRFGANGGVEVVLVKPPMNKAPNDKAVTHRMQYCVGCRNCVTACSYHHRKVFSRALSSLEVTSPGDPNFEITLHGVNDGHIACDRCAGLREPACVRYCPSVARAELADFMREAWRGLDLG